LVKRSRTWRPVPIERVGKFALLGFATTVGVAWLIAALLHLPGGGRALNMASVAESRLAVRGHNVGFGIKISQPRTGSEIGSVGFPFYALTYSRGATSAESLPPLLRAMNEYHERGIDIPALGTPSGWGDPPLALRPLWIGMLADTVLHGGLWWLIAIVLGQHRAERRRRRCQCPRCGYSLAKDYLAGCSECGWAR